MKAGPADRRTDLNGPAESGAIAGLVYKVHRRVRSAGRTRSNPARTLPGQDLADTSGRRRAGDHHDRRRGSFLEARHRSSGVAIRGGTPSGVCRLPSLASGAVEPAMNTDSRVFDRTKRRPPKLMATSLLCVAYLVLIIVHL